MKTKDQLQKLLQMTKIRLELDFIEITRKRRNWNIYFILATENPENPAETVISVFPNDTIKLRRNDQNRIDFEPRGTGELNGLFVLERDMPLDDSIRARLWVVQSRDAARNVGTVLHEVAKSTEGNEVTDTVLKALGTATPWIAVAKSILSMSGLIGKFLSKSKDSKKGFVNMDESFTTEEIDLGELDRTNRLTGFGEVGWTWAVDKDN